MKLLSWITIIFSSILAGGSAPSEGEFRQATPPSPTLKAPSPTSPVLCQSLRDFFRDALCAKLGEDKTWERAPCIWRDVEGVGGRDLFSFEDAVLGAEAGLLDRACIARSQEASEGRWVSDFAPSSTGGQLWSVLDRGTVFLNSAGLDYPSLASLADLSQRTFGLPANINVYLTKRGKDVSVCPHTDSQNVIIFQTEGRKRWKVWAPPKRKAWKDPFNRGKNGDRIDEEELSLQPPIIDTWLEPGSVLYVPIGFPHATSTATKEDDKDNDEKVSCHVTLNLDSYFYGLTWASLRAIVAARLPKSSSSVTLDPFKLDDNLHRELFSPLPLGFLCPEDLVEDDYGNAYVDYIVGKLEDFNCRVSGELVDGVFNDGVGRKDTETRECVEFLIEHWRRILAPSKYANVVSPPKRFTPASLQYKMLKDSKNRQEEAQMKRLRAFYTSRAPSYR